MLTKAFELKKEFPFPFRGGKLLLDKRTLVPTNLNVAVAINNDLVYTLKPDLKGEITLYGITYGNQGLPMVVMSDGHHTRYYWFSRKRHYTYLVESGSNDLDEAWLNLFKSIVTNTRSKVIDMYEIMRTFIREYFWTLGDKELHLTLSTKHNDELLYIEVAKEHGMRRAMFITVNGKNRLVDFSKHPLLEVLEA
jgi:hypothetical protein